MKNPFRRNPKGRCQYKAKDYRGGLNQCTKMSGHKGSHGYSHK